MYPIPPPMKKITTGELKVIGCLLALVFFIGLGLLIYRILSGAEISIESDTLVSLGIIALIAFLIIRKIP